MNGNYPESCSSCANSTTYVPPSKPLTVRITREAIEKALGTRVYIMSYLGSFPDVLEVEVDAKIVCPAGYEDCKNLHGTIEVPPVPKQPKIEELHFNPNEPHPAYLDRLRQLVKDYNSLHGY